MFWPLSLEAVDVPAWLGVPLLVGALGAWLAAIPAAVLGHRENRQRRQQVSHAF